MHDIDLRRGVDFIGVTVPFVIYDGEKNILLQKRSKNCRDEQGRWDVGGGAMEFGEEWDEAVIREIQEELGVTPAEVKFLEAYNALRDNNGTPTHWIALVHAAKVNSKKVFINDTEKIDEIGWFNLNNLPSPLHSKMMKSLEAAQRAGIIR